MSNIYVEVRKGIESQDQVVPDATLTRFLTNEEILSWQERCKKIKNLDVIKAYLDDSFEFNQPSVIIPKTETLNPKLAGKMATAARGILNPRRRTIYGYSAANSFYSKVTDQLAKKHIATACQEKMMASGGANNTLGRIKKAYPKIGSKISHPVTRKEAKQAALGCGVASLSGLKILSLSKRDGDACIKVNPEASSGYPHLEKMKETHIQFRLVNEATSIRENLTGAYRGTNKKKIEEWTDEERALGKERIFKRLHEMVVHQPWNMLIQAKAKFDFYKWNKLIDFQMRMYYNFPKAIIMVLMQAMQQIDQNYKGVLEGVFYGSTGKLTLVRNGPQELVEALQRQLDIAPLARVHNGDDNQMFFKIDDEHIVGMTVDNSNFDLTQHRDCTLEIHERIYEVVAAIDPIAAAIFFFFARGALVVISEALVVWMEHGGRSGMPGQSLINNMITEVVTSRIATNLKGYATESEAIESIEKLGKEMGFDFKLDDYVKIKAKDLFEFTAKHSWKFVGYNFYCNNRQVYVFADVPRTISQIRYPSLEYIEKELLAVKEAQRIASIVLIMGQPPPMYKSAYAALKEYAIELMKIQCYSDRPLYETSDHVFAPLPDVKSFFGLLNALQQSEECLFGPQAQGFLRAPVAMKEAIQRIEVLKQSISKEEKKVIAGKSFDWTLDADKTDLVDAESEIRELSKRIDQIRKEHNISLPKYSSRIIFGHKMKAHMPATSTNAGRPPPKRTIPYKPPREKKEREKQVLMPSENPTKWKKGKAKDRKIKREGDHAADGVEIKNLGEKFYYGDNEEEEEDPPGAPPPPPVPVIEEEPKEESDDFCLETTENMTVSERVFPDTTLEERLMMAQHAATNRENVLCVLLNFLEETVEDYASEARTNYSMLLDYYTFTHIENREMDLAVFDLIRKLESCFEALSYELVQSDRVKEIIRERIGRLFLCLRLPKLIDIAKSMRSNVLEFGRQRREQERLAVETYQIACIAADARRYTEVPFIQLDRWDWVQEVSSGLDWRAEVVIRPMSMFGFYINSDMKIQLKTLLVSEMMRHDLSQVVVKINNFVQKQKSFWDLMHPKQYFILELQLLLATDILKQLKRKDTLFKKEKKTLKFFMTIINKTNRAGSLAFSMSPEQARITTSKLLLLNFNQSSLVGQRIGEAKNPGPYADYNFGGGNLNFLEKKSDPTKYTGVNNYGTDMRRAFSAVPVNQPSHTKFSTQNLFPILEDQGHAGSNSSDNGVKVYKGLTAPTHSQEWYDKRDLKDVGLGWLVGQGERGPLMPNPTHREQIAEHNHLSKKDSGFLGPDGIALPTTPGGYPNLRHFPSIQIPGITVPQETPSGLLEQNVPDYHADGVIPAIFNSSEIKEKVIGEKGSKGLLGQRIGEASHPGPGKTKKGKPRGKTGPKAGPHKVSASSSYQTRAIYPKNKFRGNPYLAGGKHWRGNVVSQTNGRDFHGDYTRVTFEQPLTRAETVNGASGIFVATTIATIVSVNAIQICPGTLGGAFTAICNYFEQNIPEEIEIAYHPNPNNPDVTPFYSFCFINDAGTNDVASFNTCIQTAGAEEISLKEPGKIYHKFSDQVMMYWNAYDSTSVASKRLTAWGTVLGYLAANAATADPVGVKGFFTIKGSARLYNRVPTQSMLVMKMTEQEKECAFYKAFLLQLQIFRKKKADEERTRSERQVTITDMQQQLKLLELDPEYEDLGAELRLPRETNMSDSTILSKAGPLIAKMLQKQ